MVRTLRRSNPITLLLGLITIVGFIFFLSSPNKPTSTRSNSVTPPPGKPPAVKHYKLNGLSTSKHPAENRETVLILTPLAKFYDQYWQNLLNLEYPRELIELGFIVPNTREGNTALGKLQKAVDKIQSGNKAHRFAAVTILRQDFDSPVGQSEKDRHALAAQKARRAAMSKARNSLLFTTLQPTVAWVLWLDADIIETPKTLIQDLALHNRDIIVPNCFQRYKDNGRDAVRPYDFNSWHDSEIALNMAKKMRPDEIILEGYKEMATYRLLMAFEFENGGQVHKEVQLDGVGGTVLLVKADVHRDGAMFPPFAFYNLIETEGFAKMAKRLGYKPYGLPNYLVRYTRQREEQMLTGTGLSL